MRGRPEQPATGKVVQTEPARTRCGSAGVWCAPIDRSGDGFEKVERGISGRAWVLSPFCQDRHVTEKDPWPRPDGCGSHGAQLVVQPFGNLATLTREKRKGKRNWLGASFGLFPYRAHGFASPPCDGFAVSSRSGVLQLVPRGS